MMQKEQLAADVEELINDVSAAKRRAEHDFYERGIRIIRKPPGHGASSVRGVNTIKKKVRHKPTNITPKKKKRK